MSSRRGDHIDLGSVRVYLDDRNGSKDQGLWGGRAAVDPTPAPAEGDKLDGMFTIVGNEEDHAAIVFCGVVHPGGQPTPEIKYAFRRDARGRRLANEVVRALLAHGFDTLGLERIIATVDPENTPSVRVLEATGMRLDGIVTHEDGERTATYALDRARSGS